MSEVVRKIQMKKLLLPLLIGFLSSATYAAPHFNGDAHPPYHIKPNVSKLTFSGLTPNQVQTAYGFTAIPNQGVGQIIGIIDAFDDPNIENDLAVFNKAFKLAPCTTANGCFTKIFAAGRQPRSNRGWSSEIALDVEWSHAIAPQAKIMLVEAANSSFNALFNAINVAIEHGATVISMSWGGAEFSNEADFDAVFKTKGITFTASSGDSGTGVIYPAVSPYVISTGGTTLSIDNAGNYLGETAWSGSGGGISTGESEPAYQINLPIPNNPNAKRGVPDVSYNSDPNTGYSVYDSFGIGGWAIIGGTSAAAPQWAALISVANSVLGSNLDSTNDLLYRAAGTHFTTDYNDIISGTNGNCGFICTAQPGYDYVTGLGSPKVPNLINDLISLSYKK